MSEPEVAYCDDYEAITGLQRGEQVVETKVVSAPETPEPVAADVAVETA